MLLGGAPLFSAKQIFHVDVDVIQSVRVRLQSVRSVMCLVCWGVNFEGRVRLYQVFFRIFNGGLGGISEEVRGVIPAHGEC